MCPNPPCRLLSACRFRRRCRGSTLSDWVLPLRRSLPGPAPTTVTTPFVVMYAPLWIGSGDQQRCRFLARAHRRGAYIPAKNAGMYAPPAAPKKTILLSPRNGVVSEKMGSGNLGGEFSGVMEGLLAAGVTAGRKNELASAQGGVYFQLPEGQNVYSGS